MGKKCGNTKAGSGGKKSLGKASVMVGSSSKKKSKGGGKGGKGGGKTEGRASRSDLRHDRMRAGHAVGPKRKHGGAEAVEETRRRLRVTVMERQLERLSGPEKAVKLREMGLLHLEDGRQTKGITALKQALELAPLDEGFARAPLLCAYIERAKGEEARSLVEGPLFATLCNGSSEGLDADAKLARVVGLYSHVLLDYISLRVLKEEADPSKAAGAEKDMHMRLRTARDANPFVVEFLAFAPAFDTLFPPGCDLPPASACKEAEAPLLEALQYCCRLGQASVWQEADDDVRRWICRELYESEEGMEDPDKPPLADLPTGPKQMIASRWRRSREEAMDLWAEEMSVDGDGQGGEEEGGEEEDQCVMDDASDASDIVDNAARRRFGDT